MLARTDAIQPEHSAQYVYDAIYRLSQAVGVDSTWAIGWGFDVWGNRTSQTPLGLATSKVGSQTIGYSGNRNISHSYDAAGNTTNDGVHTYAYNAENQQVSMDGGAATYAYDGEGRRMKKTTSAETTYTFYGPGGVLCEFSTVNTGATAAASTDRTLYRTSERTGTAVLLFTTSGSVIENNRTLPYGEAWLSDVASANDKKFTTYDRDKESGLDYAMNRMYANTGGRFTSPDKGRMHLNIPSTLNRYTYGSADPVNHADPSENYWILVWALVQMEHWSLDSVCAGVGGFSAGGGGIWTTGDGVYVACNVWVPESETPTVSGGRDDGPSDDPGSPYVPDLTGTFAGYAENCTFAMRFVGECDDATMMASSAGGALAAFLRRSAGPASVAYMAAIRYWGYLAENFTKNALGLAKNTERITGTLSGKFRVPDFMDKLSRTIYEVKNVGRLSYTQQLVDMANWAKANNYTFEVWVDETTELTGPLREAAAAGLFKIVTKSFPILAP